MALLYGSGLRISEALGLKRCDVPLPGAGDVIVVTGKGGKQASPVWADEPGVLRRLVPQWLREADMRAVVVGFEEAGRAHGGAGALYVRLRRRERR